MEDLSQENTCKGKNQIKSDRSPSPAVRSVDSCCGSWLKRVKLWIPVEYKNETVHFLKLSGPVFISQLMSFLIGFVSMVFCGHLGKTELAGVALAIAVINVTGISIGSGLASTCDTLISQTYGSGNLKRVGVILQRGVLILLLACFPCWAVLINTQLILVAVRQSPEVAAFMYQLQGRYLQNQGIMWPQVISGAVGNVLNAIINYIFLTLLDLGVAGSAAANAISQYCLAAFLFVYICIRGLHKATWDGWSVDCLQEWGSFLHLAIPSMLMYCLECWLYEVAAFLAGIVSEVELGAQSIVYELAAIVYMFPLGFSVAASIRVGNALGAGKTEQAKLSSKVAITATCMSIVSCFIGLCLGFSKDVIGYIFTSDIELIQRVADIIQMYSFIHVAEAVAGVTGGIVRGAGKQSVGAVCNLLSFYFIGLPIGVSLMFPVKMGILGVWFGFLTSLSIQSVFFSVFLWKLNWRKATEEVSVDTMTFFVSGEEPAPIETSLSISLTPVKVNDEAVAADQPASSDVRLSVRQLLVRRGFALLLMFVILTTGVLISEFLINVL
uniref:Multidrug and toxin extrusion protein n=1 Tax=Cynoglossus semilaevis TaxID=244447 RepID=A0A3P8VLM6_CYNSE